jgi:hypothetical protein
MTSIGGQTGVSCRWSADGEYYVEYIGASGQTRLVKRVVSTYTELGTRYNAYMSGGETFRVEVNGSTLTALLDGVQIRQLTDTSITSGRQLAIGNYPTVVGDTFDNWSGGDIAPYRAFSDDFNRADSTGLGANWTAILRNLNVVSNVAVPQSGAGANTVVWASPCGTDNNFSQAQIPLSGGLPQIMCRASNAVETGYVYEHAALGGTVKIYKVISGSQTQLATLTFATGVGDTMRVSASGSTINGYTNGVQKLTVTDTSITTGKYVGIRATNNNHTYDNWSGGDILDDLLWTEEPLADGSVYPLFLEGEVVGGSVVPLTGYPAFEDIWFPPIPAYSLWLDATDVSTLTLSGSTVTQWRDKSANAYALDQYGVGPNSNTRTINSKNALDFTGTDGFLRKNGNAPINNATNGSWTAFAVVVADVLSGPRSILDTDVSNTGHLRVAQNIRFNDAVVEAIGFTEGAVPYTDYGPGSCATGTTYLLRSINTGTTVEAFRNGVGSGGVTSGANQIYLSSTAVLAIGGNPASSLSSRFDGAIGEIIAYSRVLDASEISAVESYLMAKWGIT